MAENEYFAGGFSIADIACYPVVHIHGTDISFYSDTDIRAVPNVGLDEYPNVKRWHDAIEVRPAVQRAWAGLQSIGMPPRGYR